MHRTPGGGRSAFTEREDRHLIEYLAKQKPEPRGRLGNAVYQQLVENAGKRWPWAKNHSWQSWRERYKKNQEEFDYNIRQYQKGVHRERQERLKKEEEEEEEQEDITNSTSGTRPINASTGHAEGRQGKERELGLPKSSSDLRPQKVSEKAQNKPQDFPKHANHETKIVTTQPSAQSKPQQLKVVEKFEHGVRSKTPSIQEVSSRPSKTTYQQQNENEHESSETEDERVATEDDSVPSLSENEMHELFGSFVEEEEEEVTEEDRSKTADALRPNPGSNIEVVNHHPSIYPSLQDAPTPALSNPEPQVPGAFDVQAMPSTDTRDSRSVKATETYPIRPTRPQPKQLKRKKGKNPFDTPSDISSESRPARPDKSVRKRPILEEGHFRAAFKRSRVAVHDVDEEEEEEEVRPWPPKRSKKERDAAKKSDGIATFANSRPSPQENAVASSSKTMVPPPNPADDFSAVNPRTLSETSPSHAELGRSSVTKRPTVGDTANSRPSAHTEKTTISDTRHQGRSSALILKPSISKLNNEIAITSTTRPRTDRHHDPPIKPSSDTDPFTAKHQQHHFSTKAAGKARADSSYAIANENESPNPPRHIDLHQETLSKRRRLTNNPQLSRPGSVLSSHTSLSSSSSPKKDRPRKSSSLRKSISKLDLPDDDTRDFLLAAADSITETLEKMAKDYDFSIDYVEDTFKKARSIEKTNFALKELRRDLNKLQQETIDKQKALYARINFIAHRGNDENDSDNEVPDGLVRLNLTTTKASGTSSNHSSPRKSKSKRPSLNIKPLLTDEEDDVISDYSPPNSSRAGQFARLVKQGRKQEAIEREKRRASGVFIPATQHHSGRSGRSLLAREVTDTPTPHTREGVSMDIDASPDQDPNAQTHDNDDDDDDDMYVRTDDEKTNNAHKTSYEHENEADDEFEETQQKENGDGSRVLEDSEPSVTQSQSVPEPADPRDRNRVRIQEMHDKHRALALEHRLLAMKVNADNADEMRQFEDRNDPDFLRLMSLQLVGDLLARSNGSKPVKREE